MYMYKTNKTKHWKTHNIGETPVGRSGDTMVNRLGDGRWQDRQLTIG